MADDRGAWIGQGYELKVLLEDEKPKVSVWMTADPKAIQVGTTVTFYVAATDNVGSSRAFACGGRHAESPCSRRVLGTSSKDR